MDEAHISALLGTLALNGAPREGVLKEVRKGAFQIACQRHFEATHPDAFAKGVSVDGVGNHPNAWIGASLEYHGSSKPAAPASSSSSSSSSGSTESASTAPGFTQPPPSVSSAAMATGE